MQDCLTIEDIGKRLNKLTLFALRQVGAAVGVKCPEKYRIAELRSEMINIDKGIVEQISLEKRKIVPSGMLYNGGLADSILKYRETHTINKQFLYIKIIEFRVKARYNGLKTYRIRSGYDDSSR